MLELNGENYLNGKEASHFLGVKLSTLYTYVSRGLLRSYRQGIKRQRLYKQVELEALLQLRPSNINPEPESEDNLSTPSPRTGRGDDLPHAEDWVPNI
ncbi:helix-turn-helix domain-containing protein [Ktedonospora formicarum]|uniref:Helix-turn-helix domain-containing protein n=1 Tax=Ktedonospora formicarum TaxID=2778364 RepID=A0A8J3I4E5_9CHLR|nr:helix-turn-helix domain-containing protein [Ktedonospora formicarum]GHO44619.1 hypothetical protein KSX_27820 [Ktedonospora formicarum]